MINKKTYIPITKNNILRGLSKLKSKPNNSKTKNNINTEISANSDKLKFKPNNFKTKNDLNAEISEKFEKQKNDRIAMKIYGTHRAEAPHAPALGTEGLDILGTENGSGLGV